MQLKSLTLRGFKSFAERTIFRFEPGVTAIVGPNGSGKSNISDAVMWVLGEQSARTLRSGSMEDVIFAGSAARPALGMAEVSLTLSNTDGTLPIEFSEVTITRRLYRSGESDYYINNSPCRLLDIQELLSDSGLGKGLYSIIGQGRLEEILSSKPEERRILLEEAAGILKHKRRKDRAIRKLSSMEQNLQRAKDISQEVGRQLKPLQNQANKAHEHFTLNGRLRTLEVSLAVMDLKELQQDWEDAVAKETLLNQDLGQLKKELSAEHGISEKLQLEFETKNFFSGDISEKRRKLQSFEERLRSSISVLDEKAKNIDQKIGDIRHNISQAEQRKHSLNDQQKWLSKERAGLAAALEANGVMVLELEGKLKSLEKKRAGLEGDISNLKVKAQTETRAAEDYQRSIGDLQLAIQTAENKLEFLKEEFSYAVKKKAELYHSVEVKKRDIEMIGIELSQLEFQLNEKNLRLEQLATELDETRETESALREEQAGIKARIRALEDIVDSFPTSEDIAQSLGSMEMPGLLGLVKDVIKVKPKFERAIEAVLGGDIFCVILKNAEGLEKIVRAKHRESAGITSFISNDRARFKLPSDSLPMATWALDVVSYPDELKFAISALLSHVYIVSDIDAALRLQEKLDNEVIVTTDGEVVLPNGKVIIGASSEAVGILGYQRELNDLERALRTVEKKLTEISEKRRELVDTLKSQESKKADIWSVIQSKRVEQSKLKQSLADMEPEIDRMVARENDMRAKTNALETNLKEDREDILKIKQEVNLHREKLHSTQFKLEDSVKTRDAWYEDETKLRLQLGKLKADVESIKDKDSNHARRLNSISKELHSFDEQTEQERRFLGFIEALKAKAVPLKAAYEMLVESVSFRHEQISEMMTFEEETLGDLRQDLRQSNLHINRLSDRIESTVKSIHELEVGKAQLELKVTTAVQKVVDEFDVPLEKALEHDLGISREEAETESSEVRRKIATLGPINPIAVEEYEQLQERYAFFTDQIQDLQRSKRALMKVISAIEQKMMTKFVETFEQVNESFQRVFESLFPGGQAELILSEPDDVANSGVDIIAQPGGKKLQRLSLLSGGEKSLVALAFSFAIYQIKPSPFYILDEVEAALDDINLQRFIALVSKIRRDSQILIVTHQRRTMEVADSLYGVSMQADGVSRLISQKFSEVTVGTA